MARRARNFLDGAVYHVLNRGNGKGEVFHKQQDYQAFVDLLCEKKFTYGIKLFSFCLMPNHFHLLVSPAQGSAMSEWMHWLTTAHVRKYHEHYQSSGHIWQGRFKDFVVESETRLFSISRYIERNPVRAGLVSDVADWPWSSYEYRIGRRQAVILDELPLPLPDNWREYVNAPINDAELRSIRESCKKSLPYGSDEWMRNTCRAIGVDPGRRRPGRPKKKMVPDPLF